MKVAVRVPASSANLGPGFDVLAGALALHVDVEVEETGAFAVETDLAIARDRRNLCVRAFARLLDPAPFTFRIASDVPLSGGLGASAAAVVAGLLAAEALRGGERVDVLAEATAIEGHPDNAAAALLGGFVVCVDGRALRLGVPPGLAAVLVVPHEAVRTARARAALPADVPLADAAFNIAHAALLVLGLERGDHALVAAGLADRLHQPRRAPLYPRSHALLERATRFGALGATVSGAGPSVLLWCASEAVAEVAARAEREVGEWARVLAVPFAAEGAATHLTPG